MRTSCALQHCCMLCQCCHKCAHIYCLSSCSRNCHTDYSIAEREREREVQTGSCCGPTPCSLQHCTLDNTGHKCAHIYCPVPSWQSSLLPLKRPQCSYRMRRLAAAVPRPPFLPSTSASPSQSPPLLHFGCDHRQASCSYRTVAACDFFGMLRTKSNSLQLK